MVTLSNFVCFQHFAVDSGVFRAKTGRFKTGAEDATGETEGPTAEDGPRCGERWGVTARPGKTFFCVILKRHH